MLIAILARFLSRAASFNDNIAKDNNFLGIILYTGKETLSFGDNLKAVPICALWE